MNYKEYKVKVREDSQVEWRNAEGQWHREDGPAVVWADGSKFWYKNGQYHRENGPAIVRANGSKGWYKNDQRHREDGPAVVYANGDREWWLNDKEYSEQDWKAELKRRSSKKDSLDGKIATIDGEKYKLVKVS